MKKLHLVCNAHLDPVWQWEWEEGLAATLATFRSALNLTKKYDYIFCHNEAVLYQWVETYAPDMFVEIQEAVAAGKWHIMGGWYLQPDCNMPAGESLVRQIQAGRNYFYEKFGKRPTTAINFDSFGHSGGLPQILRKTGYDSYVCCRPLAWELDIPDHFKWRGLDGTIVDASRVATCYNSVMGEAVDKIRGNVEYDRNKTDVDILLWGVGNHGGGPSRKDLSDIEAYQKVSGAEVVHSTPEAFFKERVEPAFVQEGSLNRSQPGCYTSMVLVKQGHRDLENELYFTEKLCSAAALQGKSAYPYSELLAAERNLLFTEFHDILPGSCVEDAEEAALRQIGHGREILNKLRARAFMSLVHEEKSAGADEFPIFVFNPHPYEVTQPLEVSVMLDRHMDQDNFFVDFRLSREGKEISSQIVKERSTMPLDWAKKIAFTAKLAPLSVTRFDAKKQVNDARRRQAPKREDVFFDNGTLSVKVNAVSGCVEYVRRGGKTFIDDGAFCPVLYSDTEDAWALSDVQHNALGLKLRPYALMSDAEGSAFSGLTHNVIPSMRVIEDGEVLKRVESVFSCEGSTAHVVYTFYYEQSYFDVNVELNNNHTNKAVKMCIPVAFNGGAFGQVAFAEEEFARDSKEYCAQKYLRYSGKDGFVAVLMNSGGYGLSVEYNKILLTLSRSPIYTCHYFCGKDVTRQDRYIAHIDQGKRKFGFRILVGEGAEESEIAARAQEFNERPYALNLFPYGGGRQSRPQALSVTGEGVVTSAFKQRENGDFIVRIFNSLPRETHAHIVSEQFGADETLSLAKYEVKTFNLSQKREEPELIV